MMTLKNFKAKFLVCAAALALLLPVAPALFAQRAAEAAVGSLTVEEMSYYKNLDSFGSAYYIYFKEIRTYNTDWYLELNKSLLEFRDSNGNDILVNARIWGNRGFALNVGDGREPLVGDVLKIKQGFNLSLASGGDTPDREVKSDVTLVCTGGLYAGFIAAPATVSLSAPRTDLPVGVATQLAWSVGPSGAYATPAFSQTGTGSVSISPKGVVTGVAAGAVTVRAALANGQYSEVSFTVTAGKAVEGLVFENKFTHMVPVGGTFKLSYDKACLNYGGGDYGPFKTVLPSAVSYGQPDTSATGMKSVNVNVAFDGGNYIVPVAVEIYAYYNQDIEGFYFEIPWQGFRMTLEKTSSNHAQITSIPPDMLQALLNKVEYRRAGSSAPLLVRGAYVIDVSVIIFPFNDLIHQGNWLQYCLPGDVFTVKAGFPMYKWNGEVIAQNVLGAGEVIVDGFTTEDFEYRFDGAEWKLHKEYTGLFCEADEITLKIGDIVECGISRIPEKATTGDIVFTSLHPDIVTVSAGGFIMGISAGETAVCAAIDGGAAGRIDVLVNVIVKDYAKSLQLTPSAVTVKTGRNIDLSSVTAKVTYASGKTKAVDLKDAEIEDFDPNGAGEQIITVTVKIDGIKLSGKITVNLKSGGCSKSAQPAGVTALLCAVLAVFIKRRAS